MVNTEKSHPVRTEWYENHIEDFKKVNPNKTFSLLLWDEDEFEIAEQLSTAVRNDVDHILTEIIPQNLPTVCSIKEYNFLNERFVVLKSSTREETKKSKPSNERKLIIDKEFEATYFKSSVIKNEIHKLFDSVITINEIIESKNYIKYYDCEEIFIFVINQTLLHLSTDIFKHFKGKKYLFVEHNNFQTNFHLVNDYRIIKINEKNSIRYIFQNLINPKAFIIENKSADYTDKLTVDSPFSKEVIYVSGKFINNISIKPFKLNYFLNNFKNKKIDSHYFLTEFSNLLSNTSLLENTENIQPCIELLLYHGPQKLQRIKNLDILISKLISSVYHNSNDSDISLARQLLKGFDSISANSNTIIDLEFYRFILSHSSSNRDFVEKFLDFIKNSDKNFKSKKFFTRYLSTNLTSEDFSLIYESDLFKSNDLFQIIANSFNLTLLNLSRLLDQVEFIKWINLLAIKDKAFFQVNHTNTPSLLKIIIADHLKISDFNENAKSLSVIDKILVNSYSRGSDRLNVIHSADDIVNSLCDEKEDSIGKNIHNFLISKKPVSDNILLEFLLKSSHYRDVILILFISNLYSLTVTTQRCHRILKNYLPDAEDLVSFITQH